jgi:alkylation response protein AidB-like acyl-CoA dehydrogenase
MSVNDSIPEAQLREEFCRFLAQHAPAKGSPGDYYAEYRAGRLSEAGYVAAAKAWQRLLGENGWAGITWPREHGGRGGTALEAAVMAAEQAAFGVFSGLFTVGLGMAGPAIMKHGNPSQQQEFLPGTLMGDHVWCQLFSEPDAGSDLAGVRTRAVPDGNDWVVNGQKVWTSGALTSNLGILLARTDPDVPKHSGITYFLCDMADPGIEIRPIKQINGEAEFNEVFLTDVRIPSERILGGVNGGWAVALTTLASERMVMGGGQEGLGFHDLVELARSLGRLADPSIRQRLAASFTDTEILRYLSLRVRAAATRGQDPGAAANVMKLFTAGHLKRQADLALAIEGAAGMLYGLDAPASGAWQHEFLTVPAIRIAGGSDEVQRNIIGERTLGLPAEPRLDKTVAFRQLGRTNVATDRGRTR